MSSSLFRMFGNRNNDASAQMEYLISQIDQYRKTLTGDPGKMLDNYIRNANVPQNVLNQAQTVAQAVYRAMRNK